MHLQVLLANSDSEIVGQYKYFNINLKRYFKRKFGINSHNQPPTKIDYNFLNVVSILRIFS